MARIQCVTCGGIYTDVLPDGLLYFHACPPVVDPTTGTASPRANGRNENRPGTRPADTGQIIAAGKGVTVLSP